MAIVKRKKKDGSCTYQVKVEDADGRWYPTPSFTDLALAEAEELRLKNLKRKGARSISEDAKSVTFAEFWEVWSQENRGDVSAGWKISQDQMAKDYALPVLGKFRMMEIDSPKIGRVMSRMQELGRGAQTRKHVYSLLRKMFGDAVDYYEMIAANPVKPKFHRPKVFGKERDFLLPAQAWKLLESARDHYAGPAIWIQTLAAMRVEAVVALTWDAVQWDRDQILIRRAWKQKAGVMEDYPKGKDWEYVPMIPALKKYLWELWQASQDPAAFVCLSKKGKMLPYETYLRVLRQLCPRAGVPVVTTHELRHSATEIWVSAGASQEDIRRLLNHANDSATARYMHRTDSRLTQIGQGIEPGKLVIGGEQSFPKSFPNGKKQAECHQDEDILNVH